MGVITLSYVEVPLCTEIMHVDNFDGNFFIELTCRNPPRPKKIAYDPTADQIAKYVKCSNLDVSMNVSRNGLVLFVSSSTITLLVDVREMNPICLRACITIRIQSPVLI